MKGDGEMKTGVMCFLNGTAVSFLGYFIYIVGFEKLGISLSVIALVLVSIGACLIFINY